MCVAVTLPFSCSVSGKLRETGLLADLTFGVCCREVGRAVSEVLPCHEGAPLKKRELDSC